MVRFSEIALAGIEDVTDNTDQAMNLKAAITLHLNNDEASFKSRRLSEPSDRIMYLYAMWKYRITWELQTEGPYVWSVARLRGYK